MVADDVESFLWNERLRTASLQRAGSGLPEPLILVAAMIVTEHAVGFLNFMECAYDALTAILRGTAFAALGKVRRSTPSASLASIRLWSMVSDSENCR